MSTTQREQISAGRHFSEDEGIKKVIEKAGEAGYDFIVSHVTDPRCTYTKETLPEKLPPIELPDVTLTTHEWSRLVVAKISNWIDPDSPDDHVRKLSEQALREELAYFAYLNVPAIILELKHGAQKNLAKIINEYVETPGGAVLWTCVPMVAPQEMSNGGEGEGDHTNEEVDTWHWFHTFRTACDNKHRIGVVLKITADLPDRPAQIKRWLGEPLKAYSIDTRIFTTNDKHFPVLTRAHQNLIKELYSLNMQAIVTGPTLHNRALKQQNETPPAPATGGETAKQQCLYFSYLNHLFKNKPPLDIVSKWALGYEDCLQIPLQPLGDNLESQIYATFEEDPVKYVEYKNAIIAAMENIDKKSIRVIMILGAGRGPLVSAAIEALSLLGHDAKIFAVEKNPNAIITLKFLAKNKWQDRDVTVIHSDMRDFRPDDENKADIVVSELLGSFGDNELSPECLDGALHLMKPECVSIPESYTSYVAPIHSPKLHQTVKLQMSKDANPIAAFESSYVVRVHNHFLPADPQPLFTFKHPNFALTCNDRYKELKFVASESCDVSGLVGFFRAQLYTAVSLSIVPNSHTPGLFSWFPIFFPFKEPIFVTKGDEIVINMWRCSDVRHVWYEWCMTKPVQTPIMNCRGRSCPIRKF